MCIDDDDFLLLLFYEGVYISDPRKLLDMGSCANFFSRYDFLNVTALDLAPAEDSVLRCDCLALDVGSATSAALYRGKELISLPAKSFQVVILSLLLSYIPDPMNRGRVICKARQLLDSKGLLIVADTVASVGRHWDAPAWVKAVEQHGFRLLSDPQMHFAKKRDAKMGVVQRASCFSFAVVEAKETKAFPVVLLQDEKVGCSVQVSAKSGNRHPKGVASQVAF